MKKILFIALTLLFIGSAKADPEEVKYNIIPFYFNCVEDMIYNPSLDQYFIEYSDPDSFDEDFYIEIKVSEDVFYLLLGDVYKTDIEKLDIEKEEKYQIVEISMPVKGGINYQYSLIAIVK